MAEEKTGTATFAGGFLEHTGCLDARPVTFDKLSNFENPRRLSRRRLGTIYWGEKRFSKIDEGLSFLRSPAMFCLHAKKTYWIPSGNIDVQ